MVIRFWGTAILLAALIAAALIYAFAGGDAELAAEIASAAALRLLLGTPIGDCRRPAYREQRFIT